MTDSSSPPAFIEFLDRLGKVGQGVFSVFMLLGGVFMLFAYLGPVPFGLLARRWPTCSGRVRRIDWKERRGPNERLIYPEISYEYEAGGRLYTSQRIAFDRFGGTAKLTSFRSKMATRSLSTTTPITQHAPAYYQAQMPGTC